VRTVALVWWTILRTSSVGLRNVLC
jgi:hypothetical protein